MAVDFTGKKTAEILNLIYETKPNDLNKVVKEFCEAVKTFEHDSQKLSILFAIHQQLTSGNAIQWNALPLTHLSKLMYDIGYPWLSKSYAMLALCNEVQLNGPTLDPTKHDSYELAAGFHGIPEPEVERYAKEAYEIFKELPDAQHPFPEAILCKLDQNWKTGVPSEKEYGLCFANGAFIAFLLKHIDKVANDLQAIKKQKKEGTYKTSDDEEYKPSTKMQGDLLELLGRYLMSTMPGARINETSIWQAHTGTDYDVVCSLDGFQVDFRTEFGRYFICECKAHTDEIPFDIIAKFGRVLSSVRSKFGIVFSLKGLTGAASADNARAEQLNIYRDSGIIIVSLDKDDLLEVARGKNFINLLRQKYDDIRLFKRK